MDTLPVLLVVGLGFLFGIVWLALDLAIFDWAKEDEKIKAKMKEEERKQLVKDIISEIKEAMKP